MISLILSLEDGWRQQISLFALCQGLSSHYFGSRRFMLDYIFVYLFYTIYVYIFHHAIALPSKRVIHNQGVLATGLSSCTHHKKALSTILYHQRASSSTDSAYGAVVGGARRCSHRTSPLLVLERPMRA
jgi:hypothetical protein